MSAYKISYFNFMGLAELARIMLSAADKEFEDDRFEKEEWPQRKPNTPSGQVPVLTHGDKQIPQSLAMNLYGKNNMENTMCDVVLECINDVIKETLKLFLEQDETKKLSVADLAFFDLMNRLTTKKGDSVFDSSPTMKKHSEKITSIADEQKWLEKRPVTDM